MPTANACARCDHPTPDTLCKKCVRHAERILGDFPALIDDVQAVIGRQTRHGGGGGHRQKGDVQPLPVNLKAAGTTREIVAGLEGWARHVAGDQALAGRTVDPADLMLRTRRASLVLLANVRWFRTGPMLLDEDGDRLDHNPVEAVEWLDAMRWRLRKLADRAPVRWYAGPCGHVGDWGALDLCDLDLYAQPGAETIVCDGYRQGTDAQQSACGHVHTTADRRRFLLASLRDELVDLDSILAALPGLVGRNPDRATVRQWRARQKLVPRVVAGRELYRGGDVIALALDEKRRPGPKRRDRKETTA